MLLVLWCLALLFLLLLYLIVLVTCCCLLLLLLLITLACCFLLLLLVVALAACCSLSCAIGCSILSIAMVFLCVNVHYSYICDHIFAHISQWIIFIRSICATVCLSVLSAFHDIIFLFLQHIFSIFIYHFWLYLRFSYCLAK